MTDTMEVIANGFVEIREVDCVKRGPRGEELEVPVLHDGEEIMRCLDGTVYVVQMQ